MQLSSLLGAVALLGSSVSASPIQIPGEELVARAGTYTVDKAIVTGFKVTRNATHINYAASIKLEPDHPATVLFTHATKGTDVPETSGFWDSQDPSLYFRFNRLPTEGTADANYRLVLSDAHVTGSTVNLDYFSPVADWKGKWATVYTGPSKFTLS